MTTTERVAAPPPAGFWGRVLAPVGVVVGAFAVLIAALAALEATPLDDDAVSAIGVSGTSLLLLLGGLALWRGLPAHERRLAVALKRSWGGAIGMGLALGLGLIVGSGAIVLIGTVIDPGLEDRLDDVTAELGDARWQVVLSVVSLVVLAPLGEELLFRALLLRALARRLAFGWAALISAALFTAAHADAFVIWPRAIGLLGAGLVLAWLYRRRGYWAGVCAHATVNAVAAAALLST